jgi:hypothetical protein
MSFWGAIPTRATRITCPCGSWAIFTLEAIVVGWWLDDGGWMIDAAFCRL